MAVQVYLSGWRETTRLGRPFFIPEAAVEGESFAVIDLRPDKTVADGLCLFARVDDGTGNARPTPRPGRGPLVPAGAALRGDKGDSLGPVARRLLGNKLGMDLSAIEDMRMFVSEIVHIGPLLKKVNGGRPIVVKTRENRLETWLGGELVHDMPAVAGGATEPFTYSDSDLSTHSPWADVAGTVKVVSNHAQPNFAGSYDVARYDTALSSADCYCQASFNTLTAGGNYDFLAVRIRMPTTGDSGIHWEAGWAGSLTYSQFNLLVFTSGSSSAIGAWDSAGGHSMPSRPFTARLEGNGSSLSGYMGADGPLTATDSTYSTNVRAGIMVYAEDYASSSDPKTIIDDWSADALATGATATPATVAAVAAVPAPTVIAVTTATPAVVAAVAAVPAPTVQAGAKATPSVVAAVAGVGAPTVLTESVVSLAAVAAVAAVPAPSVVLDTPVVLSAVAGVVDVPAPTVSAGSGVALTAVAGVADVPAVSVQAGSVVSLAAVAGVVAVPAVSVLTEVVASPATVAGVVDVPALTVSAGSTVALTAVAGVADVPAVSVTPPAVTGTISVTLADITGDLAGNASTDVTGTLDGVLDNVQPTISGSVANPPTSSQSVLRSTLPVVTSAAQLIVPAHQYAYARVTNKTGVTIYVGGPDVTTSNGYPILNNASEQFELRMTDALWAIAASGSNNLNVLVQIH